MKKIWGKHNLNLTRGRQFLKNSIEKGLITFEQLGKLIENYAVFFGE